MQYGGKNEKKGNYRLGYGCRIGRNCFVRMRFNWQLVGIKFFLSNVVCCIVIFGSIIGNDENKTQNLIQFNDYSLRGVA